MIVIPHVYAGRGYTIVMMSVCLPVHGQKYIRSKKGTITMFELLFEGHSADSATYNLWELQMQSFHIYYYKSPATSL